MKKNKVIINMMWKFAERCGNQGINFVISIILARILSPEEYGTVALVTVFINILQVFVVGGFGNALIQKKNVDELDFSTVFYFQVVSCVVLYLFLFVSSPYIAEFYGEEELTGIIKVLGIKLIITGVLNVQNAWVSKKLEFRKWFYATLSGNILSAVVGISMAYAGCGVWALVGQSLIAEIGNVTVLWLVVDFRPKLIFSFERLKGLFSYGWKLLIANLIDKVYINLRTLIIRKVYSAEDLAYYNKGIQLPNLIVADISVSLNSVLLPTMSQLQDQKNKLKYTTRKSIQISSYFIWPCMVGLFVCADTIVTLLLTEKWMPAVPYMRIFCIIYAITPIATANNTAIKAIGRSDIFLRIQILKNGIGIISILCTMNYGVMAIALGGLFILPLEIFISMFPNKKLINYGYKEQMLDIFSSMLVAMIMGVCVWLIPLSNLSLIIMLICQITIGITIYIILSIIFKLQSFYFICRMIKQIFTNMKKNNKSAK